MKRSLKVVIAGAIARLGTGLGWGTGWGTGWGIGLVLGVLTAPAFAFDPPTGHAVLQSAAFGDESAQIAGDWLLDGEYVLTFGNGTAVLKSLLNPRYPRRFVGSTFYSEVVPTGPSTWRAHRWQWKFSGDPENGRWVDEGVVSLTLGPDGMTLVQGSRTFRRLAGAPVRISPPRAGAPVPTLPPSARPSPAPRAPSLRPVSPRLQPGAKASPREVVVDHKGVILRYTLFPAANGRRKIYVRVENTTRYIAANLRFAYAGGPLVVDDLLPGQRFQGVIAADDFDLDMRFRLYSPPPPGVDIIRTLREAVRDHVTSDQAGIHVSQTAIGVRG